MSDDDKKHFCNNCETYTEINVQFDDQCNFVVTCMNCGHENVKKGRLVKEEQ